MVIITIMTMVIRTIMIIPTIMIIRMSI